MSQGPDSVVRVVPVLQAAMRRLCLGLATAFGVALVAVAPVQAQSAAAANAIGPEDKLQQIRQALVDATLKAPIRVQSTAWLDSEGRLHESSQFTSDARVRGVRVLSYLEDPALAGQPQTPRVKVEVDVLPPSVRPGTGSDPQACLSQQGRWRQGLHVEVEAASPLEASSAATAAVTADLREAFLDAARQSRRWAAKPRPYQPESAYERLLLGREADQADWRVRLTLQRGRSGLLATMHLGPAHGAGPAKQWNLPLTIEPQAAMGAGGWALVASAWVAALDQQTACDPVWFGVTQRAGTWQLREGTPHGLRAGDRLLVAERQHLAGRLLEPGAAPSLALLEVAATSDAGTTLRWLAGPRPPSAGDWVALPL